MENQQNKHPIPIQNGNINDIPLVMTIVDQDTEDDEELVAIITAAIYEFAGEKDFEVVRIRPSASIWTLTGRQNALRN